MIGPGSSAAGRAHGGPQGRAHHVAIYSPYGSNYYSRTSRRTGGAELQVTILARELARRGLRTAHVVYPIDDPVWLEPPAPVLIERAEQQSERRLGALAEARAIWEGLRRADAHVYIVRGSGGYLAAATAFCRMHRRHLVFSASNDLDFDFTRPDRSRQVLRINRVGIASASKLVVQTRQQSAIAKRALPGVDPVLIPSFAQPARQTAQEPEFFLWVNRLTDYKRPEEYLQLARALPQARFRMVGVATSETPAELSERIRTEAEGLPNLELVPPLRREKLLEAVDRAVAVITTSRVEGMPNTFLEAWARGVPVLSLSVDPDERIAEEGVGFVAGGSMERLIEVTAQLWADRSGRDGVRAEMGDRARRFVHEQHAPAAVADRWDALLRELLGRTPERGR